MKSAFLLLVFLPSFTSGSAQCSDPTITCPSDKVCCENDGRDACCDSDVAMTSKILLHTPVEKMDVVTYINSTADRPQHAGFVCGLFCNGKCCPDSNGNCCGGGKCCPSEYACCQDGCCRIGRTCCGDGNCCPTGYACCEDGCCPFGHTCCGDGKCCASGNACCQGGCCPFGDTCCGDSKCCLSGHACCKDYCCSSGQRCCQDNSCCPVNSECCGRQCCFIDSFCCGDWCCPRTTTCGFQKGSCISGSWTFCPLGAVVWLAALAHVLAKLFSYELK